MPVPLSKMMEGISAERRAKIDERASEIVQENRLAALREAASLTQADVAHALGTSQANLSQFEKKKDVKLSTLRNYVEAVGGKLEVVAKMPGRRRIVLDLGAAVAASDRIEKMAASAGTMRSRAKVRANKASKEKIKA